MASITSGRLAVGDELPTEWDISRTYGVSRSTAREALRRLQQDGLITRKRGAASRVVNRDPSLQYSVALGSEEDILRYTGETILQMNPETQPVAKRTLVELGLAEDEEWYSASGVRWSNPTLPPISATSVYVPARFADSIQGLRGPITGALFARISGEYGLTLAWIEQTITASLLSDSTAETLHAEPGSPALLIVRRFFAKGAGLFEISTSLHPADRFAYAVRFERDVRRPKR